MSKLALFGGNRVRTKPFPSYPFFDEREVKAVEEVVRSGNWGGYPSPNKKAKEFAEKFAAYCGAKYGICAANGTVTLEVALKAAGIKAYDEVIVPPFTWIATAQAPAYINAVPIFADIDPETYCIDPERIKEQITDRTRAIIPVHLACSVADMDAIMEIAEKHNLIVIEDCAHAHGARWRGKHVGTIGHFGSFSFQSSKLITAGEGGIILTNDKEYEEKCQSLVNCGRKEPGYDSYQGNVFGYNYRITEFQAAILIVQLSRLDEHTGLREKNVNYFVEQIKDIEGLKPLKRDPRITTFACYQFILRYNPDGFKGVSRDKFALALNAEGIPVDPYFYTPIYDRAIFPLNAEEFPAIKERYGSRISREQVNCPCAEKAAYQEALWFHYPLFMGNKEDIDDIVEAIVKIKENIDELR